MTVYRSRPRPAGAGITFVDKSPPLLARCGTASKTIELIASTYRVVARMTQLASMYWAPALAIDATDDPRGHSCMIPERHPMTHPTRNCMGCGQHDDHPRHQEVLPDGSSAFWHFDCRYQTNGDPTAGAVAESGLKGEELRQHILANDPAGRYLASLNDSSPSPQPTPQ